MANTESEVVDTQENAVEKLKLDVKIDSPSTCLRHVVVTIPREEIDRYHVRAFDELRPRAELPGFRPGKAPRKLLESRFKDHLAEQVKSGLVMDSLQQVTEGGNFSAISEPELDYGAIDIPTEGSFTFEFKIEVRPEFDIPQWKGLELRRPVFTITDEVVDTQLAKTLVRFTQGEAVPGPAQVGDNLELNIRFTMDGHFLSEIVENRVKLTKKLSLADAVVENFGELLTGAKEGDKLSTKVVVSAESTNEEARGREVDVEFEVLEIRRLEVGELDSKTLSSLGFDAVTELRDFVREELEKQLKYHQQQAFRTQATKELTKDANWELPETLVRKQTTRELQRQALELRRHGFSDDRVNSFLNAARRNATEMTQQALREHFILEKIAEDLKIEPTSEDYEDEIRLIAEQSDLSERRIRARLEKSGQMDALRNQIIERRVIELIASEAKVTEFDDDSFLTGVPDESAIQHLVAPASSELPEAKYDDKPQDGAKPSATVKPD